MAFYTLIASLGIWSNSLWLEAPAADPRQLAGGLAVTALGALAIWAAALKLTGGPARGAAGGDG